MKITTLGIALAAMLLACHPPSSLGVRDPLFPVEGAATAPHTIPVDTVVRWIREGRCQGRSDFHPRPGRPRVVYSFGEGLDVGLYENTDPEVQEKILDAVRQAPAWAPEFDAIE